MNFEDNLNGFGRICKTLCNRTVNTDISEDFTLPDYENEIRRVLYVKESMLPPAKFVSGNKLDVNGVIDYTVVYVSADGRLCSAPLSSEYSFSIPLEGMGELEISEGISIMVHSVADSSTVRVSSPRRLQIRTRISSTLSAWGKRVCSENIEGLENEASLRRKSEEGECADIICESSDVVSLADELQLPFEDCRIAVCDSSVFVESCRIEGDSARVTGNVVLKLLALSDSDGKAERIVRKLSFDAESDLDGIDAAQTALCRANGSVTDISVNTDEGRINIEASLVLEICLAQNKKVRYTSDAYSTEQSAEAVTAELEVPIVLENQSFNLSHNERIAIEDINFPEGAEIVDSGARAFVEGVAAEDGKYVVRGYCKYDIICTKDGEYSYCEARAPFKYEMSGEGEIDGFDVCIDALNARVRADGEALCVESELSGACTFMGHTNINVLEKLLLSSERERRSGAWTVCYVQGADSLWDIAKRYGVALEDINGDPASDRFVIIEG